jgi:hypothetical protein
VFVQLHDGGAERMLLLICYSAPASLSVAIYLPGIEQQQFPLARLYYVIFIMLVP